MSHTSIMSNMVVNQLNVKTWRPRLSNSLNSQFDTIFLSRKRKDVGDGVLAGNYGLFSPQGKMHQYLWQEMEINQRTCRLVQIVFADSAAVDLHALSRISSST